MTTDSQSVQILKLQFETDRATLEQSKRAYKEIDAAGRQLVESNKLIGRASEASLRSIRAEEAARKELTKTTTYSGQAYERVSRTAVEAARAEVAAQERVEDAYKRAARAKLPTGGSAGTGTNYGALSSGLNSVASVLPGGAGNAVRSAGDIAGLVDDLPKLTQGLKELAGVATTAGTATSGLGAAVGALALPAALAVAALAGIALAVNKFTKDLDEAQARLGAAVDGQVRYFELIETGTVEEIQLELRRAEVAILAREKVLAQLEAEQERLGFLGKALAVFGKGPAKEIDELNDELEDLRAQADPLQRALQDSGVKARSAAEAAAKQTTQTTATTKAIEQVTRAEQQRAQAAEQSTAAMQPQNFSQSLGTSFAAAKEQIAAINKTYLDQITALNAQRLQIDADIENRRLEEAKQASREAGATLRRETFDAFIQEIERKNAAFDLSLDRDFAGLARMRRGDATEDAISRARKEFDIQERLIQSSQRAADEQEQRQRQLAAIATQVAQAQAEKGRAELNIIRQALQTYYQQRNILIDVNKLADAYLRKLFDAFSRMPTNRAYGGPLAAGQSSFVNELPGQRESFSSGGRSVMLAYSNEWA